MVRKKTDIGNDIVVLIKLHGDINANATGRLRRVHQAVRNVKGLVGDISTAVQWNMTIYKAADHWI
eukprot:5479140-Amphidinium_carterae.1